MRLVKLKEGALDIGVKEVIKLDDSQTSNFERNQNMKNTEQTSTPIWYITCTEQMKTIAEVDMAEAFDAIVVNKELVSIAGDFNAGLLLTHILRITGWAKFCGFEFETWICLSRFQWYAETCLTPKMFTRALKILVEKRLVTKRRGFVQGKSRIQIQLNEDYLSSILKERGSNLGVVSPCGYDPW